MTQFDSKPHSFSEFDYKSHGLLDKFYQTIMLFKLGPVRAFTRKLFGFFGFDILRKIKPDTEFIFVSRWKPHVVR